MQVDELHGALKSPILQQTGSVAAGTAFAATVDAFDDLVLIELALRYSADAPGAELGISFLDAHQAAEAFVTRFLPLSDQCSIGPSFSDAIIVQLTRNLSLFVIEVIDVATHLVMKLVDWPQHFWFTLAFVRFILDISHLLLQLKQCRLDLVPASRHLLT